MSTSPSIDYRFSSPICRGYLPDLVAKKAEIVQEFESLRNISDGIKRSNQGGWQSENFITMRRSELLEWVLQEIAKGALEMVKTLSGGQDNVTLNFNTMWANINHSGDWNTAHDHNTTWSGIVFLDGQFSQVDASSQHLEQGDVVFYNPLSGIRLRGFPNAYTHHPREGEILLFPGYLLHMVIPHQWDQPRFTIAFDANQ